MYLFREDGEGVALCLSHGSTRFDGSAFVPRPKVETEKLMSWARQLVGAEASKMGLTKGVELGSRMALSQAYERTTVFSKTYPANDIPDEETLSEDLSNFMLLLGRIYQEEQFGDAYPVAASNVITRLREEPGSSNERGNAQGYGLSALERAAIEVRAMVVARQWLEEHGYIEIQDVHLTHSCDFTARKDDEASLSKSKGPHLQTFLR